MVVPQLADASEVATAELLPVVNVPDKEKLFPVIPSRFAVADAPELVTITFWVVLFKVPEIKMFLALAALRFVKSFANLLLLIVNNIAPVACT